MAWRRDTWRCSSGGMDDDNDTTDVEALEAQHVLQTYRRLPVVFERGEGMRLFDEAGRAYLDFLSGIGVASLGHAHPALARALADQAATLAAHVESVLPSAAGRAGARGCRRCTGLERAFFCNSGTEADRGVPEVRAPLLAHAGETSRTKFVAFTHAFHGRTMGALSVTWDEHYRGPFQPLDPGRDVRRRRRSGGARRARRRRRPPPSSSSRFRVRAACGRSHRRMAQAINAACARTGALLIADEVQIGIGPHRHVSLQPRRSG